MPLPFDLWSGGRHELPKQPKAGDPSALFMLGFPDFHAALRPKQENIICVKEQDLL